MKSSSRRSNYNKMRSSHGIALITSLLFLILLSALAVAFVMAVNAENRLQSTDKGSTMAYYGAEAGMEKIMADLNSLYQTTASPTVCQIQAVGLGQGACTPATSPLPALSGIQFSEYQVNPSTVPGNPSVAQSYSTTVAAGPNQGLLADVYPMSLAVTANTTAQEEVRMTRQVEVALIPVFQFGVFSSSDLDFFAGPAFTMEGRIQTNGDLYLGAGTPGPTTFTGKLRTAKEVVRDTLANNSPMSTHTGTINIPTATNGCSGSQPNCRAMTYTSPDEGSWLNGTWPDTTDPYGNTLGGSQNPSWSSLSGSTYHGFILAHEDGIVPLNLPFVQPGVSNIEILRRPQPSDVQITTESRLYSKAQIRVLLDDDPTNLPCTTAPCGASGGMGDINNVRLANVDYSGTWPNYPQFANGVYVKALPAANASAVTPAGSTCVGNPAPATCTTFFAEGLKIGTGAGNPDTNWPFVPNPDTGTSVAATGAFKDGATTITTNGIFPYPPSTIYPLNSGWRAPLMTPSTGILSGGLPNSKRWNLIDGWLRVEVRLANGTYTPVTKEWLQLGFARGFAPPSPGNTNTVHPQAILILQQLANRIGVNTPNPSNNTIPYVVNNASIATSTPSVTPVLNALTKDAGTTSYYSVNAATANSNPTTANAATTANNFYPINVYDAREGEPRELNSSGGTTSGNYGCTVNGVMNLIEIDVGNLQKWLSGTIGASGSNVENQSQNGYILYFSDHRGMIPESLAPTAGEAILGAYGFEDVINPASNTGSPNGGTPDAGEDTESVGDVGAGRLEIYGAANIGLGFGYNLGDLASAAAVPGTGSHIASQVFTRLPKCDIGRANWVSGARHALRLVDGGENGSTSNLPLRVNADTNNVGGFTVASDNPVYVLGDYNASSAGWDSTVNYPHASAAVLADTVTLLSNSWNDLNSFASPGWDQGNSGISPKVAARAASNTYYRLAISSGKNVDFTVPTYTGGVTPVGQVTSGTLAGPTDQDITGKTNNTPNDFGTDGGVHNFLRYLENWSGQSSNYNGSMVSLYYSEYETGVFKCCTTVYQPPNRNYHFDLDFTDISKMPPGTPRFQEVVNVGYKQDLTYR